MIATLHYRYVLICTALLVVGLLLQHIAVYSVQRVVTVLCGETGTRVGVQPYQLVHSSPEELLGRTGAAAGIYGG